MKAGWKKQKTTSYEIASIYLQQFKTYL